MSNDLEEKFVSDDGISTVPDAVVPAGGPVKKRRGDLNKSVDPKAGSVPKPPMSEAEEEDGEVIEEEVISIDESIEAMFEGMDLSEDFRSKVKLVFEAAVNEMVTAKTNEIASTLEEEFEEKLTESLNEAMDELVENLDSYLDYIVKEWMEENEVAIESGIKVEMAESLMDGLKTLFSEHNIDVDDDKIDVISGLEEEAEELKTIVNDTINENIDLKKEVACLKAGQEFNRVTEGLTVSQKERLKVLSEKLDVTDLDGYVKDLETLKESFFKVKKTQSTTESLDEEVETPDSNKPASVKGHNHPAVSAVLEVLNSRNSK